MIKQIASFDQARVTVVGDLMLDRYWSGGAHRISPEAPVPVVNVSSCEERAGGAGNVALNLQALGVVTDLVGLVGADPEGQMLLDTLIQAGVQPHVEHDQKMSTIVKLRILSLNQQLLRVDFEHTHQPHHPGLRPLLPQALDCIAQSDVLVLSDYGKGLLDDPQALVQAARRQQVPVLIDPKGRDFDRYRGATLLTPNSHEFEQVMGSWDSMDQLLCKARSLVDAFELQGVLVTLGPQGMYLVMREAAPYHLAAKRQSVYDVTGAGDTVIAILAASLAAGMSFEDGAALANLGAGIAVSRLGAAQVTQADLRHACGSDGMGKVVSQMDIGALRADAHSRGERVVMTNGCFDILHAGHIAYLAEAKQLGDRLVVAVNDDDSVRRLKGATRPVNSLAKRKAVLAALASVDWVIDFTEDTPYNVINMVRPDVLVKGGDYQVQDIVGGDLVQSYGGEVNVLSLIPGVSTTAIIDSVQMPSATMVS